MDWREIGGAPLVGVNGVGFIGHGRSDALAMENAIRRVREAAGAHFVDEIADAVAPSHALVEEPLDGAVHAPTHSPRRAPRDA